MLLLIFLLIFILVNPLSVSHLLWFGWVNFNLNLLFFQIFLIFSGLKLYLYKNIFDLLVWSFLSIFCLTIGLFIHQLDVFACFLLVSEAVVIFFILSFIIHINHLNYNLFKSKSVYTISFLVGSSVIFLNSSNGGVSYANYLDWYVSNISSYNDLLAQYLFFFTVKPNLMLILGLWLLLLTFFLVIVLLNSYSGFVSTDNRSHNYVWKKQNMWKQWWSKPFTRFFK